jgi:abortive infection bacteriophage resistance protein
VCGSSGICNNRDLPIRAVVMLSQAPEDRIIQMTPANAFSKVYSQITVNRWNRKANLDIMDRIEDLIQSVPVYHLACTMNESAVIALEEALFPERYERNE